MGLDLGRPVGDDEAVAHWYDAVYLPQVEAMRQLHTRAAFPRRTETNLFLSIMNHRQYLTERTGRDPGPEAAVQDFLAHFGPWCARWRYQHRRLAGRRPWHGLRAWLHRGWDRVRHGRPA